MFSNESMALYRAKLKFGQESKIYLGRFGHPN